MNVKNPTEDNILNCFDLRKIVVLYNESVTKLYENENENKNEIIIKK